MTKVHQCVYIYSKCMMQESFTCLFLIYGYVVKLGLGLFAVHIVMLSTVYLWLPWMHQ